MSSHRPAVATIALAVFLVCIGELPVGGSVAPVRWPGKSYALLVGTDTYDHWGDLANPLLDIQALAKELESSYGFEVETLENPTKVEMLFKIREYHHRDFGPHDQLLIFFAGHGHFDDLSRTGYLVARDTELPEDDPTFSSFVEYPKRLIDKIPVQHILLVADACFSGTLDPDVASRERGRPMSANIDPRELISRKVGLKTRLLLASGGNQKVPDGVPGRHTPFMSRLLGGLRSYDGLNGDGVLTLGELYHHRMQSIDPLPHTAGFGDNRSGSEFFFVVDPALAPTSTPPAAEGAEVARAGDVPTVRLPSRPSAEPVALRGAPDVLSQQQLEAVVRHKGFRDSSWNPEGDFPNRLEERMVDYERVVVDRASGLMWQAGGSSHRLDWPDVGAHVAAVNRATYAGYSDWRVPTVEELASLIEPSVRNGGLYLDPVFDAEQEECWSADRNSASGDRWHVRFTRGHVRSYSRGGGFYVRLVRSLDGSVRSSTSDPLSAD